MSTDSDYVSRVSSLLSGTPASGDQPATPAQSPLDAAQAIVNDGKAAVDSARTKNPGSEQNLLKPLLDDMQSAEKLSGTSIDNAQTTITLIAARTTLAGYTGTEWFNHHNVSAQSIADAQHTYAATYDVKLRPDATAVANSILQSLHASDFDPAIKQKAINALTKMDPVGLRTLDLKLKALNTVDVSGHGDVAESAKKYGVEAIVAAPLQPYAADPKERDDLSHFRDALTALGSQHVWPGDANHIGGDLQRSIVVRGLLAADDTLTTPLSSGVEGRRNQATAYISSHMYGSINWDAKASQTGAQSTPSQTPAAAGSQPAGAGADPAAAKPTDDTKLTDKDASDKQIAAAAATGEAVFQSGKADILGGSALHDGFQKQFSDALQGNFKGQGLGALKALNITITAEEDQHGKASALSQKRADAEAAVIIKAAYDAMKAQHVAGVTEQAVQDALKGHITIQAKGQQGEKGGPENDQRHRQSTAALRWNH